MPFQLTTKAVDALLAMCVDRMTAGLKAPASALGPKEQVAAAISAKDMETIIDSATQAAVEQILEDHRHAIERDIERIDLDEMVYGVAKDALEGINWESTARDAAEECVRDQLNVDEHVEQVINQRIDRVLAPEIMTTDSARRTKADAELGSLLDRATAARVDGVLASAVDNIVGSVCSRLEEKP